MENLITSPFVAPVDQGPRTARLEILERHGDDKKMDRSAPLCPNSLRVNGRPLWASEDDPIVVHEIRVDGRPGSPLVVTLRFLARSVGLGAGVEAPAELPAGRTGFATVIVPVTAVEPELAAGRPFVMVDDMKILLGGDVVVQEVPLHDKAVLVVDVPLLCRSVVFDDEPIHQQPGYERPAPNPRPVRAE